MMQSIFHCGFDKNFKKQIQWNSEWLCVSFLVKTIYYLLLYCTIRWQWANNFTFMNSSWRCLCNRDNREHRTSNKYMRTPRTYQSTGRKRQNTPDDQRRIVCCTKNQYQFNVKHTSLSLRCSCAFNMNTTWNHFFESEQATKIKWNVKKIEQNHHGKRANYCEEKNKKKSTNEKKNGLNMLAILCSSSILWRIFKLMIRTKKNVEENKLNEKYSLWISIEKKK